MTRVTGPQDHPTQDGAHNEYQTLLDLEGLESLLEELEESGISGLEPPESIPERLRSRMSEAGVNDVGQLREVIMRLHALVDQDEDDLTITDS